MSFSEPDKELYECRKCKQKTVERRSWESSCGGYEDDHYECKNAACKFSWWVEGIDS